MRRATARVRIGRAVARLPGRASKMAMNEIQLYRKDLHQVRRLCDRRAASARTGPRARARADARCGAGRRRASQAGVSRCFHRERARKSATASWWARTRASSPASASKRARCATAARGAAFARLASPLRPVLLRVHLRAMFSMCSRACHGLWAWGQAEVEFTTNNLDYPVARLMIGGPADKKDRIFFSSAQTIRGVTRKGKEFFRFATDGAEVRVCARRHMREAQEGESTKL